LRAEARSCGRSAWASRTIRSWGTFSGTREASPRFAFDDKLRRHSQAAARMLLFQLRFRQAVSMPSRFLRHLGSFALLLACSATARAADCGRLLMPDLMFPHRDVVADLSYLSIITPGNFYAHKKNAELDRGPAAHPESFQADDPVGLDLPIAKRL